jgi:pilus assembly protein Flp/PilA
MSHMHKLGRFIRDDGGGEVIEYAIVAGLISVVAISVIGAFGVKVLARWTSVNSSM